MIGDSGQVSKYFESLAKSLDSAYAVASSARMKNFDPAKAVEIKRASDVAARVEGIVGPPGIAEVIRALEKEGHSRQTIAYMVTLKIVRGEIMRGDKLQLIGQAVRTGVGILTEGVLVAPTEGISKFEIRSNQDGSDYLAIYFAGPIRSAGGTVAALAVVLGDVARRELGIGDFRPTETLVDRYVEEIEVYGTRSAHLQYRPPEEDIRHIVKNCPVCIDGDPTEEAEVSVHRDVPGIATNRVRSGVALVICEGIAQKASKVSKYTRKIGLDWSWMDSIVKVAKKEGSFEAKPDFRFLEESVAGRAVFSYPSEKGGWRLRYGRTRASGIMGKAVHPASMLLLDSFIAVGTQMKVERPGKSAVVTPCDSILGPVVKLKNGSVVEVSDEKSAKELLPQVEKILFLGDMLVSVGDFLKSNHPLFPSAWCEEWFELMAKRAGKTPPKRNCDAGEAFSFSKQTGIPLHPRYTYFWHNISTEQLKALGLWLRTGKPRYGILKLESFELEMSPEKEILEELCVPHEVLNGKVVIGGEHAYALLKSTGIMIDKNITGEKFDSLFSKKSIFEVLYDLSGVRIMPKSPTYIGSRMGRPEKSRERKMKKSINCLFPIGTSADKNSSISRAYSKLKSKGRHSPDKWVSVEIAKLRCTSCGKINIFPRCSCGGHSVPLSICQRCKRPKNSSQCFECGLPTRFYDTARIDIMEIYEQACARLGFDPSSVEEVKGVDGLFSASKIPEPVEKGILRAANKIYVFRDGTCRFDSTDVPLTHFKPQEIGISVQKALDFGYTHDIHGQPLKKESQTLPLFPQDLVISRNCAHYLFRVSKFVDSLLERLYGLPPFYSLKKPEDLLGHLVIGLSPHTSAGVLGRIIGFTDAHVCFAHPYFHTAKRRNCDGDEDTLILLMDGLLNFSKAFLPESRGGTMDAPLVLTTAIDPSEVDDEVHSMEACSQYPIELYELAEKFSYPSDASITTVKKLLGKPEQYGSLAYTHETSDISNGPHQSTYLKFKNIGEKINAQFALQEKIKAVNAKDAAERLLLHHFFPDLYGNLRSFSQQEFRCLGCKEKYRRIPLSGKCNLCGGKLLLTINKGGIIKYLGHAESLIERYGLPQYMSQRMDLFKKDVASIFANETEKEKKEKQKGLADFM